MTRCLLFDFPLFFLKLDFELFFIQILILFELFLEFEEKGKFLTRELRSFCFKIEFTDFLVEIEDFFWEWRFFLKILDVFFDLYEFFFW